MRRTLPESVLREIGRLDPAAIDQVREQAMPDVRDSDDLHDLLQTLVVFPAPVVLGGWELLDRQWKPEMMALEAKRRAVVAHIHLDARQYWVASERVPEFRTLFPDASFQPEPPNVAKEVVADHSLDRALIGWLGCSGPVTAAELHEALGVETRAIEGSLLRLEATGAILRGQFRIRAAPSAATPPQQANCGLVRDPGSTQDATAAVEPGLEWCDRRLLARIHRLTVATLRKQVEPVSPAQFMRWLLRWQHLAPGTQLSGERGLLEAIRQLQGFEIPASAWERQILARRVRDYDPAALDRLCLTGAVGWGRLSPHPATLDNSGERSSASTDCVIGGGTGQRTRRVVPTSVAPITFFLREECDWMQSRHQGDDDELCERGLSAVAREVLDFLRRRGASFFPDIVRGTGKLKAEVETGLWELVAAGRVTADGFDNLRALIDPRRRAGHGSGRTTRPRHATGRWSLLYAGEAVERNHQVEATCRMLLHRYGVVFRELLARETGLPRWRELQVALRRLEDRGEIRGGRFIAGFIGEQFALPEAVESLRELRSLELSQGEGAASELITIAAADPLNMVGIVVPGERVPAISARHLTLRNGILSEERQPAPVPIREAAM
jgi:ATP-dependent Lhr-like helicase